MGIPNSSRVRITVELGPVEAAILNRLGVGVGRSAVVRQAIRLIGKKFIPVDELAEIVAAYARFDPKWSGEE